MLPPVRDIYDDERFIVHCFTSDFRAKYGSANRRLVSGQSTDDRTIVRLFNHLKSMNSLKLSADPQRNQPQVSPLRESSELEHARKIGPHAHLKKSQGRVTAGHCATFRWKMVSRPQPNQELPALGSLTWPTRRESSIQGPGSSLSRRGLCVGFTCGGTGTARREKETDSPVECGAHRGGLRE